MEKNISRFNTFVEPTTGAALLGWLHKGHLASTQNEFRFHSNRMAQALGSNTIECSWEDGEWQVGCNLKPVWL